MLVEGAVVSVAVTVELEPVPFEVVVVVEDDIAVSSCVAVEMSFVLISDVVLLEVVLDIGTEVVIVLGGV